MPTVPPDAGPVLRQAATEHHFALAPAEPRQIVDTLMTMRSATHRRNETADEAEASFRILVSSLGGTPLDILEEGCRLYIRSERFFPRAPAELLRFVTPLLTQRQLRARRLAQMADEAEEQRRRKSALEAPVEPYSESELRDLMRNPFITKSSLETFVAKGWATQATIDRIASSS